jgi:hypothetical protein
VLITDFDYFTESLPIVGSLTPDNNIKLRSLISPFSSFFAMNLDPGCLINGFALGM